MSKVFSILTVLVLLCGAAFAQLTSTTQTAASTASAEKPKKQIFRANKDQIVQVQTLMSTKNLYKGEANGKLDKDTRAALKKYQKGNGLKATGTLNRATLEKMGVELTDKQKEIPVSPSSYADAGESSAGSGASSTKTIDSAVSKPKKTIFRATKDQIIEAQKTLITASHYKGEETGKLDTGTRAGLKKYQEANGLKATGTLNRETLEKMGIALTEKQKADAGN